MSILSAKHADTLALIIGDAVFVSEPFPAAVPRSALSAFFDKHASLRPSELDVKLLKFLRQWAISAVEAPMLEPQKMRQQTLYLKGLLQ